MKFDIKIKGEFENIKGLKIAQDFWIKIRCGACMSEYVNLIYINKDTIKKVQVKEINKVEKHNIEVMCRKCDKSMHIDIKTIEDQQKLQKDDVTIKYNKINNNEVVVSKLWSEAADIIEAYDIVLDVISNNDKIYKDVDFNKGNVTEGINNDLVVIQNFKVVVERAN